MTEISATGGGRALALAAAAAIAAATVAIELRRAGVLRRELDRARQAAEAAHSAHLMALDELARRRPPPVPLRWPAPWASAAELIAARRIPSGPAAAAWAEDDRADLHP